MRISRIFCGMLLVAILAAPTHAGQGTTHTQFEITNYSGQPITVILSGENLNQNTTVDAHSDWDYTWSLPATSGWKEHDYTMVIKDKAGNGINIKGDVKNVDTIDDPEVIGCDCIIMTDASRLVWAQTSTLCGDGGGFMSSIRVDIKGIQ